MNGTGFLLNVRRPPRILLYSLLLILTVASTGARAQTPTEAVVTTDAAAPTPTPTPTEADAVQRRVTRARSLAAVGKLAAAASELESLRASSTDESLRDVTRVLLMWIFVEMPDYARANALLEETFKERAAPNGAGGGDAAGVSYYTLAGQTINGVRAHLERYRTFGLNVADDDLPAEAASDLDQLRVLLERVVEHAKTLRGEDARTTVAAAKGREAISLLEDAASVRLRLARTEQDRTRWQGEVSEARQQLVASETRIASISSVPFIRPTPPPAPAATSDAAGKGAASKKADNRKTNAAPERAAKGSAGKTNTNAAPAAARPAAQAPAQPVRTPVSGGRQPGAPVPVGSLHGLARQKSAPNYPTIARTARVGGVVTVHVVVNEKGEVESVTRTDGPQQLQNAAADAARRWKFHPTLIDGQPVRVSGYISFNFAL